MNEKLRLEKPVPHSSFKYSIFNTRTEKKDAKKIQQRGNLGLLFLLSVHANVRNKIHFTVAELFRV